MERQKNESGDCSAFSDSACAGCLFFCPPFFCQQIFFSDSTSLTVWQSAAKAEILEKKQFLPPSKSCPFGLLSLKIRVIGGSLGALGACQVR
jgi:hypothetical protein